MLMSELERKAAFKSAVTLKETTMERAAAEVMGVSIHHLMEGIANRRALSDGVRENFAAFIGVPVDQVFGRRTESAAIEPGTVAA